LGGKQQRGWYLYRSLIDRLLGIQDDVTSEGFASALAQWQHKSGVEPTGILDEESFYAMVSQWQEDRLKDRTPAQPEQLVIALLSDFYDPTRLEELRQVERETYAAYKRMVAAAIADRSLGLASSAGGLSPEEKYLKIMSSFRTREYQEQLRRESPHAGRADLPSTARTSPAALLTYTSVVTRSTRQTRIALCRFRRRPTNGSCATLSASVPAIFLRAVALEYVK